MSITKNIDVCSPFTVNNYNTQNQLRVLFRNR